MLTTLDGAGSSSSAASSSSRRPSCTDRPRVVMRMVGRFAFADEQQRFSQITRRNKRD
jgi:hypothetical protein